MDGDTLEELQVLHLVDVDVEDGHRDPGPLIVHLRTVALVARQLFVT